MASPRTRRIAIATFGRSDFSVLRPLAQLLHASPDYEFGWWVGGAHFEAISGATVTDIEATGMPVWARIDTGTAGRSPLDTVQAMAAQMAGFAEAASASPPPDLVLILGDRYEAVAAGLAMVPLGIPVGHISGGSVTEGAIDDVFRHCLTKIASVHFCDLPLFAQRIHRMGAPVDRIFVTGALGLDELCRAEIAPIEELRAWTGRDSLEPGYALATLHPESRAPALTRPMAEAMFDALHRLGHTVVATYPNADPGADEIVDVLNSVASDGVIVVKSFGADRFPTAMAHAGFMIGNSSGGIIEAASFGLPVVDIGDRQRGRDHGANVLHSERDQVSITEAIKTVTNPAFRQRASGGNMYGDGHGAERVVAALGSLPWDEMGKPLPFADLDLVSLDGQGTL